VRAFRQGLKETGYIEGDNVAIVYRFAENQNDRLPELAADLERRQDAYATAGKLLTSSAIAYHSHNGAYIKASCCFSSLPDAPLLLQVYLKGTVLDIVGTLG